MGACVVQGADTQTHQRVAPAAVAVRGKEERPTARVVRRRTSDGLTDVARRRGVNDTEERIGRRHAARRRTSSTTAQVAAPSCARCCFRLLCRFVAALGAACAGLGAHARRVAGERGFGRGVD
jgi:hypothetical protein